MTPTTHRLVREVHARNRARAEASLPPVSVVDEVRKILKARRYSAWQAWLQTTPARGPIREQLLAEERAERGDPTWTPRYCLNGAIGFSHELEARLTLWKKIEDEVIAKYRKETGTNWQPRGMIQGFAFRAEVERLFRQRLPKRNVR